MKPPKKKPGATKSSGGVPRTEDATPARKAPPGTPPISLPTLDGSLPAEPVGPKRPRTELRLSCRHVFDTVIRSRLEHAARQADTPLKDVLAIADLYARVGVGFVSTNEIDPGEVAKLPPAVFVTADPTAPLPDGKPDEAMS